jgi:hypothetical protein
MNAVIRYRIVLIELKPVLTKEQWRMIRLPVGVRSYVQYTQVCTAQLLG